MRTGQQVAAPLALPRMMRSGLIAALVLLPVFPAAAQSRFAVLRFEDVTGELPAFTSIKSWMDEEVRKISKDPRSTQYHAALEELTRAVAEARKLPRESDPKTRVEFIARVEALKAETESLQRDLEEFEQRENLRINRQAVERIEVMEARVLEVVSRVAAERGFDCVFEAKGCSSTSMPFIVYARNPADITDDVLAALLAAEPASGEDTSSAPSADPAPAGGSPVPGESPPAGEQPAP